MECIIDKLPADRFIRTTIHGEEEPYCEHCGTEKLRIGNWASMRFIPHDLIGYTKLSKRDKI